MEFAEAQRLKICLVTTYYPPYHFGGDAIFVQSLARGLASRGHSVEVIHCEDAFRIRAGAVEVVDEPDEEVVVHRLQSPWGPLSPIFTQQSGSPALKRPELERLLHRPFDVVNFHNISLVGGPGVLPMAKAPVRVYTTHEHWLLCPTHIFWKNGQEACQVRECLRCCLRSGLPPQWWRYTDLIERSFKHVDAILSPSAYTARLHAEAGFAGIRQLPTYSDFDDGERAFEPPVRPRFVFAGRVTASKGIAELLQTFSRLPGFDLDVVGEGDLLDPLRRCYRDCTWIRFVGSARHGGMAEFYRNATALILPSLAPEVFPLVVLEAFACATPAIVRDAGGAPEAVQASGAGFVYRSQPELQEALQRLATDQELRRQLGRQARAAYRAHYTKDHYLDRFLNIVREIQQAKLQPAELGSREKLQSELSQ
jgi:glycosyltransferase involved in cell wall biosynthesis